MRLILLAALFGIVLQTPIIAVAQSGYSSPPSSTAATALKQETALADPAQRTSIFGIMIAAGWLFTLGYGVNMWLRWKRGFRRGRARSKDLIGAVVWSAISFGILGLGYALQTVFT
jgi:hypothetical protein